MRRLLIAILLLAGLLALAGCGNKGPLVRAGTKPARAPTPAPVATTAPPAATSVGNMR